MPAIRISLPYETLAFSLEEVIIINQKEDSELYISEVDFITDDELYRGEAVPGSLTSAPAWRIRHIVIAADGDVSTRFADGDTNFNNVWNNRASLSYS